MTNYLKNISHDILMEKLSVKKLKILAKNKDIPKYYKMLKAELIDEPITVINIPIFKPFKPIMNYVITPALNLISKLTISNIKEKINQFSEGILSYVPKHSQKAATQQFEELKDELEEEVNESFHTPDELSPKEHKEAFAGYLKTFRIDGQAGYDPFAFTNIIKQTLFDLISNNKKP